MHLQALRYLVAVAEEGHFGRAAARMHVSQPSVSQAVARLEEQFGVTLLVRSDGRVVPTEAGERVLEEVRVSLRHLDQAHAAARPIQRLRVGCTAFASMWMTAHLLTPFREAHPGTELSVSDLDVPTQASALLAGEIDVALGEPLAPDPRLRQTTVRNDPCAVWMSADHDLTQFDAVPLSALAGIPIADGESDIYPVYGLWVRAVLRAAGVAPTFAPPVHDTPGAISRIIDGSMVSLSCDMLPEGAIPGMAVRPVSDAVRWTWVVTMLAHSTTEASLDFTAWASGRAA